MRVALGALMVIFLSNPGFSKDLGTHGTLFSIQERSLLELIMAKMKKLWDEGIIQKKIQEDKERLLKSAREPQAVTGILKTQEERVFFFDPTLTVSRDIKDHEGRILFPKGYQVNPLAESSWGNPWLFIDGEDEEQLAAAKKDLGSTIILVKGSPHEISKQMDRPIYFDQQGILTDKLHIQQVPCRVSQDGLRLRIHEFLPKRQQRP